MQDLTPRALGFHPEAVGIVRRPETRAGRMTLAGDLHLYPRAFEPGRSHALVAAYPAEGHTASEGVPEGRRGDRAREHPPPRSACRTRRLRTPSARRAPSPALPRR